MPLISTPSTPSIAASSMARRASAGASSRSCFCHGSRAGTTSTRSRPRARRALTAAATWPLWTGSNVPPKTPRRAPPAMLSRLLGDLVEEVEHVLRVLLLDGQDLLDHRPRGRVVVA